MKFPPNFPLQNGKILGIILYKLVTWVWECDSEDIHPHINIFIYTCLHILHKNIEKLKEVSVSGMPIVVNLNKSWMESNKSVPTWYS